MIVIRDSKTVCLNFSWSKSVNDNLKHVIEFIKKSNGSLTENKLSNETEKLLLKYKHWNNIHEHRKQQNEWAT